MSREGIPTERLSVLMPGSREGEIHSQVPTSETEQPGMGKAFGHDDFRRATSAGGPTGRSPRGLASALG